MENINVQNIPKGQKVVIRTRRNGDREVLLRPDPGDDSDWLGLVIGLILIGLVLLYFVHNASKEEGGGEQETVDWVVGG
jgi:hypothetical protein